MNRFLSNDHQCVLILLGEELRQNFVSDETDIQYLNSLIAIDTMKRKTTRYCVPPNVMQQEVSLPCKYCCQKFINYKDSNMPITAPIQHSKINLRYQRIPFYL